jgi:2-methylisocitrate lyase-like PEP mutase family enzyme
VALRSEAYFDAGCDGLFTAYAQSAHRVKKTADEVTSIQSMI